MIKKILLYYYYADNKENVVPALRYKTLLYRAGPRKFACPPLMRATAGGDKYVHSASLRAW
jgi:hypothetical protein